MQRVGVLDFLLNDKSVPVIDVRSPGEFAEGHIPGAINLPLFDDKERAIVGTTYTRIGRPEALDLGLEIVGPKMNILAKTARTYATHGKLKVHCWRGGMRSDKMAWLFELIGLQTTVLEGGYKEYRQELLHAFESIKGLIVLHGPTGSGKTMILQEMSALGEQVLDLEKRANHKGSAFGALGMGDQPTTAQFQNDLFADLLSFNRAKRIWIESESMSIGKVYLPQSLWENMNHSAVVEIALDKSLRIPRVVEEYGHIDKTLLAGSILKIKDRFGPEKIQNVLTLLDDGNLDEVASVLLDYYDKSYEYSKVKYKKEVSAVVHSDTGDPRLNALQLIKVADELKL